MRRVLLLTILLACARYPYAHGLPPSDYVAQTFGCRSAETLKTLRDYHLDRGTAERPAIGMGVCDLLAVLGDPLDRPTISTSAAGSFAILLYRIPAGSILEESDYATVTLEQAVQRPGWKVIEFTGW